MPFLNPETLVKTIKDYSHDQSLTPQAAAERADILDQAAVLVIEHIERAQALPIHNVDPELTNLHARGRDIEYRMAGYFYRKARLLRQFVTLKNDRYDRHSSFAKSLISDADRLESEQRHLDEEWGEYKRDSESLRIKLTQRYDKEFHAE